MSKSNLVDHAAHQVVINWVLETQVCSLAWHHLITVKICNLINLSHLKMNPSNRKFILQYQLLD